MHPLLEIPPLPLRSLSHEHPAAGYERARDELASRFDLDGAAAALQSDLQNAAEQLEDGATLAEIKGMTPSDCDAIHDAVASLVHAGRYADALAPAVLLAAHAPGEARYAFTAGCCLQFTGDLQQALAYYAASLAARPAAAAVFRMGECWAALGNSDQALQCFEAVPTLEDIEPELEDLAVQAARNVRDGCIDNVVVGAVQ